MSGLSPWAVACSHLLHGTLPRSSQSLTQPLLQLAGAYRHLTWAGPDTHPHSAHSSSCLTSTSTAQAAIAASPDVPARSRQQLRFLGCNSWHPSQPAACHTSLQGQGDCHAVAAGGAWRSLTTHPHRFADDYDRHHRVNKAIFSRALRVIFPDGRMEVMPTRDALKAAAVMELDLVEFKAPQHGRHGELPVAKLVKYAQLKQQRRNALLEHIRQQAAGPLVQVHVQQHRRAALMARATQAEGPAGQASTDAGAQEASSRPVTPSSMAPSISDGAAASAPAALQAAAPGQGASPRQSKAAPSPAASKKVKRKPPKEVFFSPHIAKHDIQVKLRRVRSWLRSGYSVSLSQEVDSTGDAGAAERAIHSLLEQLADTNCVQPGRKVVHSSNMVSVLLVPVAATTPAS